MAAEPTFWGPIVAGISFCGAVGGFGYFMDSRVDESFRARVRDKLQRRSQEDATDAKANWPGLFISMFDRLFDSQENGRPRLWRSAVVSILVVITLLASVLLLLPERKELIFGMEFFRMISFIFIGVTINIFGDFFSIWESRAIIERMANLRNNIGKSIYLVLDLIVTSLIFYASIIAGSLVAFTSSNLLIGAQIFKYEFLEFLWDRTVGLYFYPGFFFMDFIEKGGFLFYYNDTEFSISSHAATLFPVFFYSTLFTSVWVWLFIIGGVLWPAFDWLRRLLNVDEYPVGSAMAIGALFGGIVVTIIGYIRMAIIA